MLNLHQELSELLAKSLRHGGLSVVDGEGQADLAVRRGADLWVLEIKTAPASRRADLEARLADAHLRGRKRARLEGRAQPVAVVGAPAISDSMVEAVRRYASEFLPGAAWGVVDRRGRIEIHGAGLDYSVPPRRGPSPPGAQVRTAELFSDLNQWLLKVALAGQFGLEVGRDSWPALGSAKQLARCGRVSLPTAWRFLEALRHAGHLVETETGLGLVRVDALVEAWSRATARPVRELRTRWGLSERSGGPRVENWARERAQRPGREFEESACFCLFSAADRSGHGHVSGVPVHVYVPSIAAVPLADLGLQSSQPSDPVHIVFREPRWPESVFRGAVVRRGVLCTDILQTWLDLIDYPARGAEQARVVWNAVIGPALAQPAPPSRR